MAGPGWVYLWRRRRLPPVCLAPCSARVEDEVGGASCAALAAAAAGSAEVTRAVPIRPTPEPVVEAGTAAAQVEAGGGVEVGAEVDGAVVEAVAGEVGMRAGAGADEAVGEASGPSGRSSTMAAKGAGGSAARLPAGRGAVARVVTRIYKNL